MAFIFNAFEDSIDVGVGPQNMWVTDPWQLYLQYSNGTVSVCFVCCVLM